MDTGIVWESRKPLQFFSETKVREIYFGHRPQPTLEAVTNLARLGVIARAASEAYPFVFS